MDYQLLLLLVSLSKKLYPHFSSDPVKPGTYSGADPGGSKGSIELPVLEEPQ